MSAPIIGASVEVITHHVRTHMETCTASTSREVMCPCGTSIAIICADCNGPVFVALTPGRPCAHARALVDFEDWL